MSAEHLDHRRGPGPRFPARCPEAKLLQALGGKARIEAAVDAFYDRIEEDAELRPMFVRDLTDERAKLAAFLIEWLGGQPAYSQRHGLLRLRERHRHSFITARAAGRWLDHLRAAILGDREGIEAWADEDPSILDLEDPASDTARCRPMDYAARVSNWRSCERLLGLGAKPGACGVATLGRAADRGREAVVGLLLDAGVDGKTLGFGPWVMHPTIARWFVHGVVDTSLAPTLWSSWIWDACTGNHGAKDRPDYVRRILECGGDANASQRGRSALHFAAKAGFARSCEVLLEAGAAVNALDTEGRTPLDEVEPAGPSVDKAAVRAVLLAAAGMRASELRS